MASGAGHNRELKPRSRQPEAEAGARCPFGAFCVEGAGSEAAGVRERLASVLAAVNARPDRAYPLSFSMGMLACPPTDDATIEMLLERADQ